MDEEELINIPKVIDILDISYHGVKKLIENDLVKTKNNQVICQSVLDLIEMRDDALSRKDVLKYAKFSIETLRKAIKNGLFPEHDFKIGKFFYWKVETVRKYL